MKKVLTIASLLALVALPSWAGGVGVMGSSWNTDEAGNSSGGGIKIEFDVGPVLDFELRSAWLEELEFSAQGEAFSLEAVPVDVGLSYEFLEDSNRIRPFLGGGLSFIFLNAKAASDTTFRVDDEAGFYVVTGLEGAVNERFEGFVELLYRDASAAFRSDGFLNRDFSDFGADLTGAAFNLGVMLSW